MALLAYERFYKNIYGDEFVDVAIASDAYEEVVIGAVPVIFNYPQIVDGTSPIITSFGVLIVPVTSSVYKGVP